jgi:crotonobetainyl-CoA:carnitine CoA-transferase CaiB-like acyl-CoA transferase
MAGPLDGVRVLDLTSVVMGPFATHTLAALGAEVVKVEPPEGDNMRHVGPMRSAGMGHVFLHLNRGKQSVVLDLKQPAARAALERMIPAFDVLICNVRPDAMARLGLDYDACAHLNPRLVYVSACGYAPAGPQNGRPAYDDLIQGAAGLPWLLQQHGVPEPRYVPTMLADRMSGLHAVYAVTAALYARERTGRGQLVTVPMFEAIAQMVLGDHLAGRSFEPPLGPAGYARLLTPERRPYRTADGWLGVLVHNDGHWRRFFDAIGAPADVRADPRFASIGTRAANIGAVYGYVAARIAERTTAEWEGVLAAADIPFARVSSIDDLVADPQLAASGLVAREAHPSEGTLRTLGQPTAWSGTPLDPIAPTPRLGEHTAAVLARFGSSAEQIRALLDSGAARQAD